MATKNNNTTKIVVGIGVVIIITGAILYIRKLRLDKAKKLCIESDGIWNDKTKKCEENPLKKLLAKSLTDLNFKSASKDILPSSFPFLDELAKSLNDYPTLTLTITGHTDSDGTDEYNQKLSEDRANSVKNYLIKKLIAENRLIAVGKGESEPIDNTNTASGKEKNRRVVMTLAQTK
jgi:outer membrane protein OmpA-like peptidoglycan-associated protein